MFFLDGVGTIGGGLGRTLEFLRQAVSELGARRILCYGFSVGGFAALHYGLLLHAARVLALIELIRRGEFQSVLQEFCPS